MRSPESIEFTQYRSDLEDQERFKSDDMRYRRAFVPVPSARIVEVDPRDRD